MRIAILGAGFAGLSVAWHLLQRGGCEVTLFDPRGVGGGASGIAAGLLHPYVGEEGKRSFLASEGIEATQELIAAAEEALGEKVVLQHGILRHTLTQEQEELFHSHVQKYGDVRSHGEKCFWIESGMTIDCPRYLQGLFEAVKSKGGRLVLEEVADLTSLKGFDAVIVATGAAVKKFPELAGLNVSVLKGQVLLCEAPDQASLPETTSIGKGYLALLGKSRQCCVGSTYERGVKEEGPDAALAKEVLFPKIAQFFPAVDRLKVVGCRAAQRVTSRGHYFPTTGRVHEGLWVFTALGSRGLLYHAIVGKVLAQAVHEGDASFLYGLPNNFSKG